MKNVELMMAVTVIYVSLFCDIIDMHLQHKQKCTVIFESFALISFNRLISE